LACLPDKAGGLPKQIYLDAMHLNLRREENRRVFAVRIDLDGYRDILEHWLGDGVRRDFKRDPLRCPGGQAQMALFSLTIRCDHRVVPGIFLPQICPAPSFNW
jgi:hypothetical protein